MKNQRSFTLIELLIVIAIVSLIASISLVALRQAREEAKEKSAIQFAAQVYHALGAHAVGVWNFDNDDASDSSGNDNHGTVNGATPTDGIIGRAFNFDGNDDIRIPDSNSLDINGNTITIETWVKPSTLPPGWLMVAAKNSTVWYFGIYSGHPYFRLNGIGALYLSTINPFKAGEWHHYIATYDGSQRVIKIFLNGKEIGSTSGVTGNIRTNNYPLMIGAYGTSTPSCCYFRGVIDEVKIYNESLSSAQIQKLYVEGAKKRGLLVKE